MKERDINMKRLIIVPEGWPCLYSECRPGFFTADAMLGLKTEYGDDGYCDSGEAFASKDRLVQPVEAVWETYEE